MNIWVRARKFRLFIWILVHMEKNLNFILLLCQDILFLLRKSVIILYLNVVNGKVFKKPSQAQLVEDVTVDFGVMSSVPTLGVELTY